jgi:hypothetical protein
MFTPGGTQFSPTAPLDAQQRQQQLLEAQQRFVAMFNQNLDTILTDPQQRARFNQLFNQFRGFDAFFDPTIQQRLNLTDTQLQQLAQFRQEWVTQMQNFGAARPVDRQEALRVWDQMRLQFNDRVNQVLTEPQRRLWMDLIGDPFNFDFDIFFNEGLGGTSQDFQAENLRMGTSGTAPGSTAVGAGSTIGTSSNPTPGSTIGTSSNPTPGSTIGTSSNPTPGTPIGTGQTDRK